MWCLLQGIDHLAMNYIMQFIRRQWAVSRAQVADKENMDTSLTKLGTYKSTICCSLQWNCQFAGQLNNMRLTPREHSKSSMIVEWLKSMDQVLRHYRQELAAVGTLKIVQGLDNSSNLSDGVAQELPGFAPQVHSIS
jgi:hypothetical protein